MEHVVFSAAVDGAGEEFRRVSSLEEAVRVVEHLRNDLGIEDASVFSLTAVPLAFRTYYRVEVPGVPSAAAEPLDPAEAQAPALLAVPSLASDAEPLLPLALVSDVPGLESGDFEDSYGLVPAPAPALEPVPSLPEIEPLDSRSELAELADLAVASDEASDLPAMPGPGLQPRLSELPDARVEGESRHSLGYFTG
jgi:hypothetical protein